MSDITIGILGILVLMPVFLSGLEIGFAMGILGFIGFSCVVSMKAGFAMIGHDIFDLFTSYAFTVLPLFVLMGQISYNAGFAKKLYATAYKFIGHVPGGLAIATVGAAAAFGSVVGSITATAATFSSVAMPEMDRYHYSNRLSAGIIAASSTLGCLIPPSVPLIIYGMITEQSIGKLFLGSIIPGLLVCLFLMLSVYVWSKINPSTAPKGEKSSWKDRLASLRQIVFVVLIFFVVMGGILKGFFTPTEAGSIGCFAVGFLAFVMGGLTLKGFGKSLTESLVTAGMVIILIAGSTIFGHFITITKIPFYIGDWISNLPLNRHIIIIMIAFIYLLGGTFIDDFAFMILATPIFYPVVLSLGFDLIWFGIFLELVLMIGTIIPPMALVIFVVNNLTEVRAWDIYIGVLPFLISMVIACFLLMLFPQIVLFLPSLLVQ